MHRLSIFVAATLTFGSLTDLRAQELPLKIQTYRADDKGFNVASVLVTGKADAVLIDAQFTLADAHRVVALILSSGKNLRTIYVSQGDPDFYFGLEVLHQAFPDAQIVATRATVDHIKASLPGKMKTWGPTLGSNGPKAPIVPEVLEGNRLVLEGQSLDVIGLDGPSPLYTFVWIPSIKAVLGGVRVFGDMHLWMTDSPTVGDRRCWTNDLRRIQSLAPITVVPGHSKIDTPQDLSAVTYSVTYLAAYGDELGKATNSSDLVRAMKQRFPTAIGDDVLVLGAKVNKGEVPWERAAGCV